MSDLEDRIIACDKGRFEGLVKGMRVKDVCLDCTYFNPKGAGGYRCAVSPTCIGVTLSSELNSYILWKIGEKTSEEHMAFLGI